MDTPTTPLTEDDGVFQELDLSKVERYIGRGFFQMIFQQNHDVNNKYAKSASSNADGSDDDEDDDTINAGVDIQKLEKKKRVIKNSEGYEKEEEDYDYYEVLGLEKRWLSTPDDIRKAYKKKVKEYHPDHMKKNKAASSSTETETQQADDTMFKVLSKAYETLLDEKKKLAYDSSEPFDDSIPSYPAPTTPLTEEEEQKRFFSTFAPVFERWAKWSRSFPNVPKLGDIETSWDDLERFYSFWSTFKSWREFSGDSEYDESMADSREERRWMKRQNDKINQKKKKEEKKKLNDLIELARKNDPRVKRKNEELELERKRKEEERNQRELERILKEEQERKEEEEKQRKLEQEEKERKQKEKEEKERKRQEQEQTIKRMREMCEPYVVFMLGNKKALDKNTQIKAEDLEFLLSHLPIDNLIKAVEKLEPSFKESQTSKNPSVYVSAFYDLETKVRDIVKKKEEEKQQAHNQHKKQAAEKLKSTEWSKEELTLLAKAIALFPGGTLQRWVKIAEYVGTRTPEEVQQKTGEIRKKTSSGEIPKRDEKEYFDEFQKNNAKNQTSKRKEEEQRKMDEQYVIGSKTTVDSSSGTGSSVGGVENWSAVLQKALEAGIRQFKELKGDAKWEKIAEVVPGKNAQECKERFEYCRQLALAKKNKQ